MVKKTLLLSILLNSFWLEGLYAQLTFTRHSTKVIMNDQELEMPWAGGLNSIQYNTMDLNKDKLQDLVLFDRSSNKITTYLRNNNAFSYAPEYEAYFPANLTSWVLLRDYDCDGLNDLFTNSSLGMRVFRNTGNDPVEWEPISDPVKTLGTRKINLFFNASDIASITDLDGDGDLDILAYNFATGENIDYHQNMSVERDGTCGLDFERITRNYGGISECNCAEFTFNEPCPVNGRILHAGGKSLLSIDLDGDGVNELLTGEETCDELTMLTNIGNMTNPAYRNPTDFFKTTSTGSRLIFPSAFQLDLNADGVRDLAVSTSLRESDQRAIDFSQSSYYYKNTGSEETPQFELVQTDFLQRQMIDVGERAHPTAADYDMDGDQDLFIGSGKSEISGKFLGTIHLFKNTGSPAFPEFTLITSDYLNISTLGLTNVKPQFIDLNKDNKPDLTFLGTTEATGKTRLYFVPNAGDNNTFEFNLSEIKVLTEISALADFPILNDINGDGLADLLIGRRIGSIEYYQNQGTNLNPNFQLTEMGGFKISPSVERLNLVPFLVDLLRDGSMDLITTDASGQLTVYQNFQLDQSTPIREIFMNELVGEMRPSHFGRISWPIVTDFYNTGTNDLIVGTIGGGVYFMQDITSQKSLNQVPPFLEIYPNPSNGKPIQITSNQDGFLNIYSITGQLISENISIQAYQSVVLESYSYPEGVYLMRFRSNTGLSTSNRLILTF